METNWQERATSLLSERYVESGHEFVMRYHEDWDVAILHDDRSRDVRDAYWVEMRNNCYGWHVDILAEAECQTHGVMILKATRGACHKMAREFGLIPLKHVTKEAAKSMPLDGCSENMRESLKALQHRPLSNSGVTLWGKVVVKNGKPIGLYYNGAIIEQEITLPWEQYR